MYICELLNVHQVMCKLTTVTTILSSQNNNTYWCVMREYLSYNKKEGYYKITIAGHINHLAY
jgi:hypothetical protein